MNIPGFGGNMQEMMNQVKTMQDKIASMQAELESRTVQSESGGGMVKVSADGKQNITKIVIDKELLNPSEIEILEDLIVAAVNKAIEESKKIMQGEMAKLTGGILPKIPGLTIPGL